MFLYLSSQGLGPSPHLLSEHAGGRQARVVANALDDLTVHERTRIVADELVQLSRLGFDADELDLRDHFDSGRTIHPVIAAADLLWVIGGNTFTLCRAFHASGAVPVIRERVARGLVYAGYSAGAVAAGPDLVAIDLVDDPSTRPSGYPANEVPNTLGLLEERVIPHAGPGDLMTELMSPVVEFLQQGNLAHLPLRDGEALVVHGARRWIEPAQSNSSSKKLLRRLYGLPW